MAAKTHPMQLATRQVLNHNPVQTVPVRYAQNVSGLGCAEKKTSRLTCLASTSPNSDLEETVEAGIGQADDFSKFVRFMHLASPYVVGHRGKTFVIAIPGEVVQHNSCMAPLLDDIALLHGLGARMVIVCGAKPQIDAYLQSHGQQPRHVGAYRVTNVLALQGALQAAGAVCTKVAAHLSKAPSMPMVRRHARGDGQMHFAPTVNVVHGNYVIAKRRGIVNGVDFGLMGQVRCVQRDAIMQQLHAGNIVLLTNVGVSAAGDLLNCNAFDVATHAAVELKADKLLCLTGEDVRQLQLPHYLPLDDAETLITSSVCQQGDLGCILSSLDSLDHITDRLGARRPGSVQHSTPSENPLHTQSRPAQEGGVVQAGGANRSDNSNSGSGESVAGSSNERAAIRAPDQQPSSAARPSSLPGSPAEEPQTGPMNSSSSSSNNEGGVWDVLNPTTSPIAAEQQAVQSAPAELSLDLDSWQQIGFPNAVLAAVVACKNGVKRAHLIDASLDGGALLELYTRDGITGVCMIAADLYEGIRQAQPGDHADVTALLSRLRERGFELHFPLPDLANHLDSITVIEREGKVLGCACYADLGAAADGVRVAEITAIIVHQGFRRLGFGDSLLDFVEQELRLKGFRRIALVVDAGSVEFFVQRDFEAVGDAHVSELLPLDRRQALPEGSLAQLYVKPVVELEASVDAPAGKRVGF